MWFVVNVQCSSINTLKRATVNWSTPEALEHLSAHILMWLHSVWYMYLLHNSTRCGLSLASSPGHYSDLSHSRGEELGEALGSLLRHRLEMVDSGPWHSNDPRPSPNFSPCLRDKIWEWPGDEARLSQSGVHVPIWVSFVDNERGMWPLMSYHAVSVSEHAPVHVHRCVQLCKSVEESVYCQCRIS